MEADGEYKVRERYSRGLFRVSLALVVLLAALAAFLPFRYAGDRSSAKTALLLENWGRHLYTAAQDFAGRSNSRDSLTIERLQLTPSGSTTAFDVDVAAVGESADVAAAWAQKTLEGFDLSDYLIDGKLPARNIGDIAYIDGQPFLLAVTPPPDNGDGRKIRLTLGPSLNGDFDRLQNDGWKLTVVRSGRVAYASDPRLPVGALPQNGQLRTALAATAEFETTEIFDLDILDGQTTTVAPLKDFDQWNVIGAFILTRSSLPERGSPLAWLLALAAFVLAVGFFALAGRQLYARANARLLAPVSIMIAAMVAAALLLLFLGIWMGGEVTLEARQAFDWLASLSEGGAALGTADFLKSLDMLAVVALMIGTLGIAGFYIYSTTRLRHLADMRQAVAAAGFLAPAFVHLLIFTLAPVLFAFFISFHRWDVLGADKPFIGLANYFELFSDSLFWQSLLNTLIYSLHVPLTMAIALALALALQHNFRGVTILRTLFFLPYITSFVAISTVWQWLYNADFGLLNYLLSFVGVGPIAWLSDPATAMIAVMILSIWIQLGYQMVIFIAGLQGIPTHLYEAAVIDGAGPITQLRRITLPLLRPTIFFILVTSIINSFQVFTYVYVMTQGGPLHSTEVLVYHIYKNAWEYFRMGYASALSWVLFVLILFITIAQFAFFKKRIEEATA